MTKDEKDYSDYVQHSISLFHGQQFMLGFLLAVFAIVLTQLPDPNALHAQLVLFLFSVLIHLTGFLSLEFATQTIHFCRRVPPFSKRTAAINILTFPASVLELGTVTLLFALWNLPYLTIASGISWVFFAIAEFVFIIRPFQKWRKTVR